jgi:hypothetical protein
VQIGQQVPLDVLNKLVKFGDEIPSFEIGLDAFFDVVNNTTNIFKTTFLAIKVIK